MINIDQAIAAIRVWIETRQRHYICVRDAHGIIRAYHDQEFRRIHMNAGLVTPDGMPLVWLAWRAGYRQVGRVYGPDLMLAAFDDTRLTQARHFFYGGSEAVLDAMIARFKREHPGLVIAGRLSPPFDRDPDDEAAQDIVIINKSDADIVWVALGTPRQEQWMSRNRAALVPSVLIGIGAAFNFHAGAVPQAPKYLQNAGLEWLFRLATEPRRLWRRYLATIPQFAVLIILEQLGLLSVAPLQDDKPSSKTQ